jgi:N-acetylmuramoyl-L-alanine amidase
MKIKNLYLLGVLTCLLTITLNGCVSVPTKEALPTYDINGITYLPLASLCNLKGINLEYDTFAKTAVLIKGSHKINLMVGERLVLVDNLPKYLRHPVDMYQGTVVVPYNFKEQILDTLFKEIYPPRKVVPPTAIKKVVIDAGHGGKDPGAIGRTGAREKVITLDIAKRLSSLLRADGINVVMTRSIDIYVPLSSRVDMANNAKADIFLSVHVNANRVKSISGCEVYYVSPTVNDSARALSAAQDARLDFDSSCFASNSKDLKATLWDMLYTQSRQESIELARSICQSMKNNLDIAILGIKAGRYYVLKGARMPTVLIEIGFLSNYNEERMLKNGYYRQSIAEAIERAVLDYGRDLTYVEKANQ